MAVFWRSYLLVDLTLKGVYELVVKANLVDHHHFAFVVVVVEAEAVEDMAVAEVLKTVVHSYFHYVW
jgi:hypothetical protein